MAVVRHSRPGTRGLAYPALAALLAALALAGCKRDLELPGARSFTATAARESLAPREAISVTVSGGQPPFSWTFADGGRLSGDDATVEPSGASVTYRAGSAGSAQDVLEVRDAAGGTARVRITVTARLAVTPPTTIVAPGGIQSLQGSGGKPPYTFTFTRQSSGTGGRVLPEVGTSTFYSAGSTGDVFDEVAVHDSVVPPTTVLVSIRVTSALQIFPRAIEAAPNEVVSFTAFGGQPPYLFYYEFSPSGGQMLDAAAGVYQLGPWGPAAADPVAVDTIRVTDANNRSAYATIVVAPQLTAQLASEDVRGGTAIPVLVAGGKPPYEFAFAPRGNRSHGSFDSFGGLYTPGPSPGAKDVLQVTDAAGTTITIRAPAVGPLRLATGGGVNRCVTGDFDGNRVEDLAFLHRQMKLTQITGVGTSTQVTRTYYVGSDFAFPPTWEADRSGDGRAEIFMLGARQGAPRDANLGGPSAFWGLVPGADGTFAPQGLVDPGGISVGANEGVHLAMPTGNPVLLFAATCGTGLWGHVLPASGVSALYTNCASVDTPVELGAPPSTRMSVLASADLDGDAAGLPDLAWMFTAADTEDSFGPVYYRFGAPDAGFLPIRFVEHGATARSIPLPGGWYFQTQGDGDQRRVVPFPANRSAFPSGLLLRLAHVSTGRGSLWILSGRPATWVRLPDFLPASGGGYDGAMVLPERVAGFREVVAWSADGDFVTFQLLSDHQLMQQIAGGIVNPADGQRHAGQLAAAGFPVGGACAADVNGDGAADLVLTGASVSSADVLFGADDVVFGERPHLRGMAWPAAFGDFDGDGVGDVVASEDGLGLSILYGTEGQLGWSERVTTGPASFVTAGPYVAGVRGDSLLYRTSAGAFRLVPNGLTAFEPSVAVSAARPNGNAVPAGLVPLLLNASLGGPDAGPDLVGIEQSNFGQTWAHVLWREGGRIVDLRSDAVGATSQFASRRARDCWFLPVGQESGQTSWGSSETHAGVSLAGLCIFEDPADSNSPRLVLWVGATIVGSAADGSLRLSSWTVSGTPYTGPPGSNAAVAALGTFGGRAHFALANDGDSSSFAIVSFPPAGGTWNPATWGTVVPRTAVTFVPASVWSPFLGAVGDIDGDGDSDAVVTTREGRLLVLRNVGSDASPSFAPWPGAARGHGGLGVVPLGVRRSMLDQPTVVTFSGDFDNVGLAAEIVPLW